MRNRQTVHIWDNVFDGGRSVFKCKPHTLKGRRSEGRAGIGFGSGFTLLCGAFHIDNEELSLDEFGRLLRVHAGRGMRVAFVPEEFVTENPKVEIREPEKRDR